MWVWFELMAVNVSTGKPSFAINASRGMRRLPAKKFLLWGHFRRLFLLHKRLFMSRVAPSNSRQKSTHLTQLRCMGNKMLIYQWLMSILENLMVKNKPCFWRQRDTFCHQLPFLTCESCHFVAKLEKIRFLLFLCEF